MLRGVILQASVGYTTMEIVYECMAIYCLVSIYITIVILFIILGIFVFVEKP